MNISFQPLNPPWTQASSKAVTMWARKRVKPPIACSQRDRGCLCDSCKTSHHFAARGNKRLGGKETRRGLSLLAIDRLAVIFLASCYLDWNIILEIPLLEYPTQLTRLLDQHLNMSPVNQPTHNKDDKCCRWVAYCLPCKKAFCPFFQSCCIEWDHPLQSLTDWRRSGKSLMLLEGTSVEPVTSQLTGTVSSRARRPVVPPYGLHRWYLAQKNILY